MKTTTIQVPGPDGEELFVAHDFPAGPGKGVTLRGPGNPVSRLLRRLSGAPWQPEDARSAYTGYVHGWTRTRLRRRYVVGGPETARMAHRVPRGTSGEYVTGYGPLRSRVRLYAEQELATTLPRQYGPRAPIADSLGNDGLYNPIVDAPGGRWIGPYQGVAPAEVWHWQHVRTLDRSTGAFSDPPLEDMLDEDRLTPTCRFDVQARADAKLSILPSGKKSSAPWAADPMKPWLSLCGNAGYNGAHLVRQYRHAMAMRWLFADRTFARIASEDILALARDVSYTLSPHKARYGYDGDMTRESPYWFQGCYMNWSPLAYKATGPVGPDGGRTMGWYAHVLACAMEMGHRSEFIPTAIAFITWAKDSLLPSGFIQSVRYDETGGPQPKDCGVQAHELSAPEIEATIFAPAITALCFQTIGTVPAWCSTMLDNLCGIYLRHWTKGSPPAWGKYWVHGEIDGRRYLPEQVHMAPSGPRSTTNAWWLFECGLRFGSLQTRKDIYARKAEIENLWSTRADIRPWAAGLMGALDNGDKA